MADQTRMLKNIVVAIQETIRTGKVPKGASIKLGKGYKTNPEIDKPIKGYINKINKCGGVVTIASCAGHKEHERFKQPYVDIVFENKEIIAAVVTELAKRENIEMTDGIKIGLKETFEKAERCLHIIYSGNDGLIKARKILFENVFSALKKARLEEINEHIKYARERQNTCYMRGDLAHWREEKRKLLKA